jgi:2-dehydro-3-deoxyglucarate aldolase/4-hydroxy-2-oxoheptanedioate aldolase
MGAITQFRRDIQAGKVLLGPSVAFTDPQVTDALADSADFVWIDLEHGVMSPEALIGHLLAGRARNKPVLVRLPGSHTSLIKPVLDAGAEGLVIPQVRDAQEVRNIVGDCRYPPAGQRGFGPRVPSNYGRTAIDEVVKFANEQIFVAVMIENVEALANLDEILTVPGLDAVVIGPMDLSASMGLLGQVDHPAVVAAMETIIAKAHAAGLSVGVGVGDAEHAALMIRRGVQWIQMGGDSQYVRRYYELMTAEVHARLAGP